MNKNILKFLIIGFVMVVLFVGKVIYAGVWSSPSQTPPGGNVATPMDLGYLISADKLGALTLSNDDNLNNGLVVANGRVQIGSISGTGKLSINGKLRIYPLYPVTPGNVFVSDAQGTGSWKSLSQGVIFDFPSKAVMAFSEFCPTGWIPADGLNGTPDLRGRNIIGTGSKSLNSTGGAERHQIPVSFFNMFSHSHEMGGGDLQYNDSDKNKDDRLKKDAKSTDTFEQSTQPFNVMDPYIALLYCMKE